MSKLHVRTYNRHANAHTHAVEKKLYLKIGERSEFGMSTDKRYFISCTTETHSPTI